MTTTVEIPGGTATFRTRAELRARDTMLVKAATAAASGALGKLYPRGVGADETDDQETERLANVNLTLAESMKLLEMKEATIVALLQSWTLDRPLPTIDTIGDLPDELHSALEKAVEGLQGEALESTSVDFSASPDKESPTLPSSD